MYDHWGLNGIGLCAYLLLLNSAYVPNFYNSLSWYANMRYHICLIVLSLVLMLHYCVYIGKALQCAVHNYD